MLDSSMKKRLILALSDDRASKDITTRLLKTRKCGARVIANKSCLLAGVEEAKFLFTSKGAKAKVLRKDGKTAHKGQAIMEIRGSNKSVLPAERTALNVLGRMSAVATYCGYAQRKAGKKVKVGLTRKTIPGFGMFEKKAAEIAGIWPHRKNLEEMFLIKDNHLAFEDVGKLLGKAKKAKRKTRKRVEIEVENLRQLRQALEHNPDIIMLDNMAVAQIRKAVPLVREKSNALIELSGGINLSNISKYSGLGADIISMGALTKDAGIVDFSLEVKKA